MKRISSYLKMRVLGAIDFALGRSKEERIKNVAQMTFTDEDGIPKKFTWRTIQEWFYLYKNHGIARIQYHIRKDKGKTRKTTPEKVAEALNQAMPHFRNYKWFINSWAVDVAS